MNIALGFTLTALGLVIFISGINKTTGAMLSGLIYGRDGLKSSPSSSSSSSSGSSWVGSTEIPNNMTEEERQKIIDSLSNPTGNS